MCIEVLYRCKTLFSYITLKKKVNENYSLLYVDGGAGGRDTQGIGT